jgi:hypothetical protein
LNRLLLAAVIVSNLPAQDPPTYAGLRPPAVTDAFWNPANPSFFSDGAAPILAAFQQLGMLATHTEGG